MRFSWSNDDSQRLASRILSFSPAAVHRNPVRDVLKRRVATPRCQLALEHLRVLAPALDPLLATSPGRRVTRPATLGRHRLPRDLPACVDAARKHLPPVFADLSGDESIELLVHRDDELALRPGTHGEV